MSNAEGKGESYSQLLCGTTLARKDWWETRKAQTRLQFSLPTTSSEMLTISAPKQWADDSGCKVGALVLPGLSSYFLSQFG